MPQMQEDFAIQTVGTVSNLNLGRDRD